MTIDLRSAPPIPLRERATRWERRVQLRAERTSEDMFIRFMAAVSGVTERTVRHHVRRAKFLVTGKSSFGAALELDDRQVDQIAFCLGKAWWPGLKFEPKTTSR